MIRQTCGVQEGDRKWMSEFEADVEMLACLVEEAFATSPVVLLSPHIREMIRDRGRSVKDKLQKVRGRLVADNPGTRNLYGVEP